MAKLISSAVEIALLFPDLHHSLRFRRDLLTPSNADPDRPELVLYRSVRFFSLYTE